MVDVNIKEKVADNVAFFTVVLSIIAYLLVILTFEGVIPYPSISVEVVNLLSHLIAMVNSLAAICLVLGWINIRKGNIERHRRYMTASFVLILAFLFLYLPKVGGGGEKYLIGAPGFIHTAYLMMLAVHIILSAIAMPIVLYVFLIGWSKDISDIPDTRHPVIGKLAASAWILSLILGVTTYVILNHIYSFNFHPI